MNENHGAALVLTTLLVGMFTCVYAIGYFSDKQEQMEMCTRSTPYLECYKTIME